MTRQLLSDTISLHQLRVLRDTVRNPLKGRLLGRPTAEEAEATLREKFHYTNRDIESLKNA